MSDIPAFLHEGFESLMTEMTHAAYGQGASGKPQYAASVSEHEYYREYGRLIERRGVHRVVFVSDSFTESFPDDDFLNALSNKVVSEPDFELYAFVGILSDEGANPIFQRIREASKVEVGHVEVRELGMKPLLRGVFTNEGGICRAVQLPDRSGAEVYRFHGVDLTEEVLAVTRSYLTNDFQSGQ